MPLLGSLPVSDSNGMTAQLVPSFGALRDDVVRILGQVVYRTMTTFDRRGRQVSA